jgi:hypothetical protein
MGVKKIAYNQDINIFRFEGTVHIAQSRKLKKGN